MRKYMSEFGATGWPLTAEDPNPFYEHPDGVEMYRKALWTFLSKTPEGHKARAQEILFNLLLLKENDTFDCSGKYHERLKELEVVIRRAAAYYQKQYTVPDGIKRPWSLTREQFYALPHTITMGKGKKGQKVKVYTTPDGSTTRNFPYFYDAMEIVDEMRHRCIRWAYDHGEHDVAE